LVAAPKLRLVTSNPGKYREIRAIFAARGLPLGWDRRTLPEPQADDLETVVRTKLAALPADGTTWVVDDSGLFLSALGGFPGVYSAYALDTIGLVGVLRLLHRRPRQAVFRTIAGVRRRGTVRLFRGEVTGRISAAPRGHHGFGYDPLFIPTGRHRTFGETPLAEKNRVSHRARAMDLAAAYIAGLGAPRRKSPAGKER
jgi:XTP/dITP diphosphohydrolase